ncbi:helix-turn-helix domain-containing protein [Paenibacillus sp. FSL R7-0048]|uniref:response regulator transcription factor n=1 Tax=Paenibacillus TaxID=44249 RepID=UPI002116E83C|nr:helix-turn-helix domain-containing protein [Paenibacillus odorifer]
MNYTMVLVDDEKGIIDGLKVIIRRYLPQCEVIGCAYDGDEGYELVRRLQPQIVITDIRMLHVDGLEMIEKLKKESVACKFIILSGYAEFEYARKGMYLGVRYYLNKPIEEEELQDCTNQIIKEIEEERVHGELLAKYQPPAKDSFSKKDIITEIKQYVADNFNNNISLADLSNRFYLNLNYLSQLFKEKTGQNYLEYLTQVRMERTKELLTETDLKIYEIAQMVGYSDPTHFSKVFERAAGCKPTEYRKIHS